MALQSRAVIFENAKQVSFETVPITDPGPGDLVVDVDYSGVSSGIERLLWSGQLPGLADISFPLVPGVEAIGTVVEAGSDTGYRQDDKVFVSGAACFGEIRGFFGATASRLVVPASRVMRLPEGVGKNGVLLALAASAHHAISVGGVPDLIIGHGILGRLLARLSVLAGGQPLVWETDLGRLEAKGDYHVCDPVFDQHSSYGRIIDATGANDVLDRALGRLGHRGTLTLAGYYGKRLSFDYAAAFLREAQVNVSAEWQRRDLANVCQHVEAGHLSLDGLITDIVPAPQAPKAYEHAFSDPSCIKMVFDWGDIHP